MSSPKTPEEALALIKEAAENGNVAFAPSQQAEALDPEIQEIFAAIRVAQTGRTPKRGIMASDESSLSDVLDFDVADGVFTLRPEEVRALSEASQKLGIELHRGDLFVDAALRLRELRSTTKS